VLLNMLYTLLLFTRQGILGECRSSGWLSVQSTHPKSNANKRWWLEVGSELVKHAVVSRALKFYAQNLIQLQNVSMGKSKPPDRTTPLLTNLILLNAVCIQRRTGKRSAERGERSIGNSQGVVCNHKSCFGTATLLIIRVRGA
jgi:hypothetical protein